MRQSQESELVGAMYDAAMGHRTWDAVGARLTHVLEGSTLNLYLVDPIDLGVDLVTTHNFTGEFL